MISHIYIYIYIYTYVHTCASCTIMDPPPPNQKKKNTPRVSPFIQPPPPPRLEGGRAVPAVLQDVHDVQLRLGVASLKGPGTALRLLD